MDYSKFDNPINREYVKDFVEKELARRKTSQSRRSGAFIRLKVILNEIAPNKDIKKWNKKDVEEIAVAFVERYKSYWSVASYFQILRQLIKYIHGLEDDDKLPDNYRPLKTPNMTRYKDRYRSEDKIITPEEAFKLVDKNGVTKRDSFVFMFLLDLGLRPHELLRKAKKKDITIDALNHYHFKVDEDTKTGAREPMLVFSIPHVQQYIKNLKDDDYLFPYSDRVLWKVVNRITGGKCCPYDLRASSMSYYGLFLTDQELKARYGSEEFKHYVKLNKNKLASKLDKLAGRETGENGNDADLEKIAPKFCVNCKLYSKHTSLTCDTCGKHFDIAEEIKKKIFDEIAYQSYFRLKQINIEELDNIARSVATKHGAKIE